MMFIKYTQQFKYIVFKFSDPFLEKDHLVKFLIFKRTKCIYLSIIVVFVHMTYCRHTKMYKNILYFK